MTDPFAALSGVPCGCLPVLPGGAVDEVRRDRRVRDEGDVRSTVDGTHYTVGTLGLGRIDPRKVCEAFEGEATTWFDHERHPTEAASATPRGGPGICSTTA